jgi:uncharacterized membrane protein
MIDKLIDIILQFLEKVFVFPELVVVLIAILPIVEARLAIPIALEYGFSYFKAWGLSFVGSSLFAPILLLFLIPFIKWLAKTKLFKKVGSALYDKFAQKADGVIKEETATGMKKMSADMKKFIGVLLFVAIPLPLTGVWTGCAVASILGLKYWKSLVAVISGNLIASSIITLLCLFFEPYIDYIITALGIIAIVVVILLIVKIILHKPKNNETEKTEEKTE